MDIQKEREAFESVFTEAKGWDLTFIMGCYQNIKTLTAFAGWRAAKAQAVPEGFVVVPKEPTEEMVDAGVSESDVDWKRLRFAYIAMIEAQEQAHD